MGATSASETIRESQWGEGVPGAGGQSERGAWNNSSAGQWGEGSGGGTWWNNSSGGQSERGGGWNKSQQIPEDRFQLSAKDPGQSSLLGPLRLPGHLHPAHSPEYNCCGPTVWIIDRLTSLSGESTIWDGKTAEMASCNFKKRAGTTQEIPPEALNGPGQHSFEGPEGRFRKRTKNKKTMKFVNWKMSEYQVRSLNYERM